MERYDYLSNMKQDIRDYIDDNLDVIARMEDDEREEKLYEDMFIIDSVTGNASGSYTFSNYKAEECLCHNTYLLQEALKEFGIDPGEALEKGAEYCDVTIRCFLLAQALAEVLSEYEFSEREKD